jgi:hypothetical protein
MQLIETTGTVYIELGYVGEFLVDLATEKPVPDFIIPFLPMPIRQNYEIIIKFMASGYAYAVEEVECYHPHRPLTEIPQVDYELQEAYLYIQKEKIELPKEIQKELFQHYQQDVQEAPTDDEF